MTEMRSSNPADAAALEGTLNAAGSKMPKDADDWLNMFISTAESFPGERAETLGTLRTPAS
jgi:hypothetical protein